MNDKPIYSAIFTPHIKGTLDRDITDQHVTLSFGPNVEELNKILQHSDKPIEIEIVGYGNDGKNEGLLVKIPDIPYFGAEKVHITLSVSEDSTPVKTGDLAFDKEIPDHIPKKIYGTIGTFTAQKGVVFDKTYVENNCFDNIKEFIQAQEEKRLESIAIGADDNIIIDFEFNSLRRYGVEPEIIQVKAYNCANGKSVIMNFDSNKPITYSSSFVMGGIEKLENTNGLFSKKKLEQALNSIGANINSNFVGFSVSTDEQVLNSYGVYLDYVIDLQDNLRLSVYEKDLALHGCSMEVCHKIATGEFPKSSHSDISELQALINIYEADKELYHKEALGVHPFGNNAGKPLIDCCDDDRRWVDGYRWNNNNLLADSLDNWVEFFDKQGYDYYEDEFYQLYIRDEFFNSNDFYVDNDNNLTFSDYESFDKCRNSDFFMFAINNIYPINNLDEFDFEQEYEYDEYEQEYEEEYEYDDDYEQEELSEPDENGFIIKDGVLLKYVGNDENVVVPKGVTIVDSYAFINCDFIKSITLTNAVTSIGDFAFHGCDSLTSITTPDSVTSIGINAFAYCDSLTSLIIGDGVTSIGSCAFGACTSLVSIRIPDSVTSIDSYAFNECISLESIIIEGNPKLGEHIFNNCNNLKEIIVRNEEMKQHLYETGNVPEGCEVKVVEKELDKEDEITNIGEIGTNAPTNQEVGKICKEIMDSKEEFVYDEVPDNEFVTSK